MRTAIDIICENADGLFQELLLQPPHYNKLLCQVKKNRW
jgi:hypothetical protein